MTITSGQIKRIHTLLAKNKLMAQKYTIIAGSYNVDSTRDLTSEQAEDMINWLDGKLKYGDMKPHQFAMFDHKNRQHMKLLSLAIEYGWFTYSDKYKRNVADLNRLGLWIMNRSQSHKPILKMTEKELQITIYQFEQMVKKHYIN